MHLAINTVGGEKLSSRLLENDMNNAFQGKRIRQNESKLAQMKRREKRLHRIGLSVINFTDKNFPWLDYFRTRNEQRKQKRELEAQGK